MSWLSELFGGGGGEDPLAVQGRQEQARREEQARQDAARAQQQAFYEQQLEQQRQESERNFALQQQQFEQERTDRAATAAEEQRRYEQQLAALREANQPTELDRTIEETQTRQLQEEQQRADLRRTAGAQANAIFAPEFEQTYVPSTYDDPYAEEAYTGQRGRVDEYLNNLLRRNVITEAGFRGGQAAAEEQAPGVRTQLSDLGEEMLAAQRSRLTDVGNRARNTAATLELGQTFNPDIYTGELANLNTEFGRTFADRYRAGVPEDLFDLARIQQRAGTVQGAQNLAFDPNAVAGIPQEDETELSPTRRARRPTAVF